LLAKGGAIARGFQAYEVAIQQLNLACRCSTEVLLSFAYGSHGGKRLWHRVGQIMTISGLASLANSRPKRSLRS